MPIYEFYCADCHTVFSFRSRRIDTTTRPHCPRCGRGGLERRVSSFAISTGRSAPETEDDPLAGLDEARLERALEGLAGELDGIDEEDPRQAAALMRKLYDATGMAVGPAVEEAMARLAGGEDMEKIEADLGDQIDAESDHPMPPGAKLAALRRKLLPPGHDPKLYEM